MCAGGGGRRGCPGVALLVVPLDEGAARRKRRPGMVSAVPWTHPQHVIQSVGKVCSVPPSGLQRCRQRLPCSGGFLPGTRRASPVSVYPVPACCRHYPAGSGRGLSQDFRDRCCLRQDLRGSASRTAPHEACLTFDSYGPQGCSPSPARVCQEAPPPPCGCEASPQLHGAGSCHVGTFTHWVVPTSLVTPDPDMRVLPHPAPRQTASLRAVAYPLVQEARLLGRHVTEHGLGLTVVSSHARHSRSGSTICRSLN